MEAFIYFVKCNKKEREERGESGGEETVTVMLNLLYRFDHRNLNHIYSSHVVLSSVCNHCIPRVQYISMLSHFWKGKATAPLIYLGKHPIFIMTIHPLSSVA